MKLFINNKLIINKVENANTFLKRLKGLLFKKNIPEDYGLFIYPCKMIHCFFMQFAIDVIFIDKNNKIIGMETVKPWNRSSYYKDAFGVIETHEGIIKKFNIKIGKVVKIQ